MAPKWNRKGANKAATTMTLGQPHRAQEWVESVSSKEEINRLVFDDIIVDRESARWRPATDESFPTPMTHELVVFVDYFLRGFGVPIHPFLHDLIHYYGINLCHLHPNSILQVAIFIHLCEAFLGIHPHFNLF